jgi:hypothetical protein
MDSGYSKPVKLRGAVCFLVINQIDELPRASISSALLNSDLPVIVGYTYEADVAPLRDLPVQFRKINEVQAPVQSGQYAAFDEDDFYRIVMNKWELLIQNLPEFDFLIYSDIDVLWIRDAASEITRIFNNLPEKHVVIQSFGEDEVAPSLCMGFVGFKNSPRTLEFLSNAKMAHAEQIVTNPRIGDDEIATQIFRQLKYPDWLHRLSSIYFPVGNTLNLFTTKPVFPGLTSPTPFIFHLNYVVGLQNKRLMLKILSNANTAWKINSRLSIVWRIKLNLKKFKFFAGLIKKSLK